ncbi:YbjN domain-containing protein [Herpetosiphon sp. NSE202]|uniref:YbjN domain-containing protein n=1 Tax=Herpetosiphon sp. NSE202 TaxID=3351349 RepID=UPI0036293DCA
MEEPEYAPELDPEHEQAAGWRGFSTLGLFLEEDGWYPQRVDDRPAYRMHYQGANVDIRCLAQIKLEQEQLLIYAYAPMKVPEDKRSLVAEYLVRANYGLHIGNFELDFNDGEVRFKSSLDFEDETLTFIWIRNTIYPSVHLMNRYFPGMMMVMYGEKTPAEAITVIEQ